MAFREPTRRRVFRVGLDAVGRLGLLVAIASAALAVLGASSSSSFPLGHGGGAAVGVGDLMSGAPRALEIDGGTITLQRWAASPRCSGRTRSRCSSPPDELALVTPVGTFDLARRDFRGGDFVACAELLRRTGPRFEERTIQRRPPWLARPVPPR